MKISFKHIFILIPVVISLLLTGCRGSQSVRRGDTGVHPAETTVKTDLASLSKMRRAIIEEAETWLGTPYEYGGYTKHGSDCSGMVLSVYLDVTGIKLPRNSAKQAEFCKALRAEEVVPGDLVFFATGKDPAVISHVGIMISDEDFIHMSTSKGAVISKTTTPYYTRTFMGYGRVPGM